MSLDAEVKGQMAVTREAIGASLVYGNFVRPRGYTGRNVTIAVIDSGIDAAYPGVKGRLVYSKDFTGTGLDDQFGHGTHIVDLIAGAEHGGNFGGVAPDARIVSLKVLQADGSGQTSDVIAALDWVRANHRRYQIRVVNISLGHPVFESYTDDPLAQAVQRLIDDGVVVVASAGNYGKVNVDGQDVPVFGGISSPGNLPDVITVGALNTFGTVGARRRLGGHLQLEGPERVRQGVQAGSGGARQQAVGLHGGRHQRARRDSRAVPVDGARRLAAHRDERHERVGRRRVGRGRADARGQPVAAPGPREDGAAAVGAVPARGRAGGRVGQPERGRRRVDGEERPEPEGARGAHRRRRDCRQRRALLDRRARAA